MKNTYTFLATVMAAATLTLAACEEEIESAKPAALPDSTVAIVETQPPVMSRVESQIPTTLKFGFEVAPDQVQDTIHYLVLRDTAEAPTQERLLAHPEDVALPMDGNRFRTGVRSNLKEQTKYVVYAVLKRDKHRSKVASMEIATGKAE